MATILRFLAWLSRNWEPEIEPLEPPVSPNLPPTSPAPAKPVESPITTPKAPHMTNQQKLYQTAVSCLHKDMSPNDLAPDSLACMESLDGVYLAAFGEHLLSMPARLSTQAGYKAMLKDPRLEKVETPQAGDIVISPTGYSSKGAQHGHTGIWGNNDVMSNDSTTGLFLDNYTHQAWYNVFSKTLGFPVYFFRVK